MNGNPADELRAAIAALKAQVAKKKVGRHEARELLIPLGFLILEGTEGLEPLLAEIDEVVAPLRKAWEEEVAFELKLAASEHIQSVDLRYLNHPRYDFEYATAARERLEARIEAADALGLSAPDELVAQVQQADAILEPFLRSREGGEPVN